MPAKILSGTFQSGKKGLFIRRILVTSQFAISIGVVVLMLFMNDQINFMRNHDMGFKKENIITIPIRDRSVAEKLSTLKEELLKYPGVISVTTGSNSPAQLPVYGYYWFEGEKGIREHDVYFLSVGHDYIETLGLELVRGRDFDKRHTSDMAKAVIINETLVEFMGWEDPIGKRITRPNPQPQGFQAEVVGVVKLFDRLRILFPSCPRSHPLGGHIPYSRK